MGVVPCLACQVSPDLSVNQQAHRRPGGCHCVRVSAFIDNSGGLSCTRGRGVALPIMTLL